jgi:hypothetical protein
MAFPGRNRLPPDAVAVTPGVPRRWQPQWRASPPAARLPRQPSGTAFHLATSESAA